METVVVVVVVKNVRNNKHQYIKNSKSIIGLRRRLFLTIDVLYLYYSTVRIYSFRLFFTFLLRLSSLFLFFPSTGLLIKIILPTVACCVVERSFCGRANYFSCIPCCNIFDDDVFPLFFLFLSTYECGPSSSSAVFLCGLQHCLCFGGWWCLLPILVIVIVIVIVILNISIE